MISVLIAGQITSAPEFKKTADRRQMVVTSLKARLGRENSEGWQVIAYAHAACNALLRLGVGESAAVQGVPSTRIARIGGETVIQRIVFAETVVPLKPQGGDDASSL